MSTHILKFTETVTPPTICTMDARTARTLNIRHLVKKVGGPTKFANLYGQGAWVQGRVSRWISATNPVGIGHVLARKIEQETGLPNGVLDYYPMPEIQPRIEEPRASYGDPDEAVLLELFRRMPKRKKRAILELMNSESPPADE